MTDETQQLPQDPVSALRSMEEADRVPSVRDLEKSLLYHVQSCYLPIGMLNGYLIPDVASDPSLLLSPVWGPLYWGSFALFATIPAWAIVVGRVEKRIREARDAQKRLAPIVVQGIREGVIRRIDDRQGTMLANVVGERTLREALQASPAFSA